MSDVLTLAAEARDRAGKGASRAVRREGRVPCVIYGNKVVDAQVEWPLGAGFVVGAGINNLLDERYSPRVRPGGGGGFDPGLPRNVFLSVGWQG